MVLKDIIFSNKQVSEIVELTPRQVLSWSEKGLIVAFEESTGAGTKRGYNYVNLLEFGLCKKAFSLGIGFRAVKKMLVDLRKNGTIRDWSSNFKAYHKEVFERHRAHLDELIEKEALKSSSKDMGVMLEIRSLHMQEPYKIDRSKGVLAYFYGDEKNEAFVIPWEMEYVTNLNMIKEAFEKNGAGFLIDLGKIKEKIDTKI